MIFGPDGRPLCNPLPDDQDGILYADLDIGLISLAKAAADPVGHYSRPDVVRVMVNRTRNRRIPPKLCWRGRTEFRHGDRRGGRYE